MSDQDISQSWENFSKKDYKRLLRNTNKAVEQHLKMNYADSLRDDSTYRSALITVLANDPKLRQSMMDMVLKMVSGYPRADDLLNQKKQKLGAGTGPQNQNVQNPGYRKGELDTPGIPRQSSDAENSKQFTTQYDAVLNKLVNDLKNKPRPRPMPAPKPSNKPRPQGM